ncbi:MAG TPA: hypothetical protein VMC81_12345 [Rhodocyclaceae bacterium]|nr:hypothetical protein [Rhodocyclaceae bacterium]
MEFRSDTRFLGLPLVHVAIGTTDGDGKRRGVATGWIAIGDVAFGVLLSCGGFAVGGVSLGGVALGLMPIGGLTIGLLAIGGFAFGVVAIGGLANAWYAAIGGVAIAGEYAIGGFARAAHVLAPPPAGALPPISSIPHAPFEWLDALMLGIILVGLLAVVRAVARRL